MNILSLFDGKYDVCSDGTVWSNVGKRKKIESMFDNGYTAFRCPTQAELARFHTYPVEIMEQFTPPQAQSLMGDGWHCGSIQWLFDKLKEKMENE